MHSARKKNFRAVTFTKSISSRKIETHSCVHLSGTIFFRASIPCSHRENRLHTMRVQAPDHRSISGLQILTFSVDLYGAVCGSVLGSVSLLNSSLFA